MITIPRKGDLSGHFVSCENCGKVVYQTKTQYNRAKHHFCSNKCQKEFQHNLYFENRECPICKKQFSVSKKSTQLLCSVDCQKIWQTQQVGELNHRFTRQKIKCFLCGKEFYIKAYKLKSDSFRFCSLECSRKWYANVTSQRPSHKEAARIRAVEILEKMTDIKETKPQKEINNLLAKKGIKYTNEYNCKYFSIDNYLDDYNLMIEVMGDFWHSNPQRFRIDNLKDVQKNRITKDKAKHTYIKNNYDIEMLYLWETDINNNIALCEKLLDEYIKNNGRLLNYHSFNYYLDENNQLKLKDNIMLSYFDKCS